MSNPKVTSLASYVNDIILNPGSSIKLDDDGLEESNYAIPESNNTTTLEFSPKISQLKIQNELRNDNYKGKKVLRKDLGDEEVTYDPELANYFMTEGNQNEEECEDSNEDSEDGGDDGSDRDDSVRSNEEVNESDLTNEENESDNEDDCESFDGGSFNENEDDRESIDGGSYNEKDEDEGVVLTSTDSINKSSDVKNQFRLYDSLMEIRIGMQKIVTISNQLPQHDTFNSFLKLNDQNYKKNLTTARKSMKLLVGNLLKLEEELHSRIPDLKDITPSNNEESKKRKLEELEETINKKFKATIPYREKVLLQWHDKTKFLSVGQKKGGSDFGEFEISPVQQMHNILSNKEQLLRRTQLRGFSRGNQCAILGKIEKPSSVDGDQIDPEIFDDGDFYSRLLEDFLKSKMGGGSQQTSAGWMQIQSLRKKASKKQSIRVTKGRTLRKESMAKLDQFMAPCKMPRSSDSAMNQLFASLFGSAMEKS